MKLQYLGDSHDSFKWHYHDILAKQLHVSHLDIIPMLLPHDGTLQGNTRSNCYQGSSQIQRFCTYLRDNREIGSIKRLPEFTTASYKVRIHKEDAHYSFRHNLSYFSDVYPGELTFIDPCTGFEPEHGKDAHISFEAVSNLLNKSSEGSIISIFQFKQRKPMQETYQHIYDTILSTKPSTFITEVHSPHVMIIQITKSERSLNRLREINRSYCINNMKAFTFENI